MTALTALALRASTAVPALAEMSTTQRSIVIAGSAGVILAAVIVPLGVRLDRILSTLARAVDEFQRRDRAQRDQLRELEIRHHVSEADRRRTATVMHTLSDAVLVTDAFNEIEMANDAAARILGFGLEQAIHQPIDRVIGDDGVRQLITEARDTANFDSPRRVEREIRTKAGDGSSGVFEVALQCVENHRHEVGGVVTILHDLTREREVSQMKTDFVSKASHELRTPLSSIRAYVEMLVDGEAGDEEARREFYQIIQNETHRLARLIDNMLNISRIEAGIVQIERRPVDLRAMCERAIATLEPQAREKQITFRRRLAAADLKVEGDEDMLYQVVLNLASNAVKYTPEGGRITITADSDGLARSVLVSVSDTGLGVPPDAVPRLFDKFFRVENYKRIAQGTGLGLSLCKHIVEAVHRGEIGVESDLGMGSRFWFTIPMRHAGSQAAA
jgi:two-component system phosphate regulon sensor histidine kinase PhoR